MDGRPPGNTWRCRLNTQLLLLSPGYREEGSGSVSTWMGDRLGILGALGLTLICFCSLPAIGRREVGGGSVSTWIGNRLGILGAVGLTLFLCCSV